MPPLKTHPSRSAGSVPPPPEIKQADRAKPGAHLSLEQTQCDSTNLSVIASYTSAPRILSLTDAICEVVLTASEQFGLTNTISQSLAGRTALLRLLPFSLAERRLAGAPDGIEEVLYSGCYPRIHDEALDPTLALSEYCTTYVERDARRIGGISKAAAFRRFLHLCAGRVGQLVNLSNLGADAGVAHTTARGWLNVLEAMDVVFRLEPYHANIRKRLTKSPKLYFVDVGLASYLNGIQRPDQLITHPLRGPLFENAAVLEAVKHAYNQGRPPYLSFLRTAGGLECDLLHERGDGLVAIEIKSGATVNSAWFAGLRRIARTVPRVAATVLVYGGAERQVRGDCPAVPLGDFAALLDSITQSPLPPVAVEDPSPPGVDL